MVTDALLQHEGQQHVLDCLHGLANLVKHHNHRLARVHLEPCVRCELRHLHVVVHLGVGQSKVAKVKQCAVDVRDLIVRILTGQHLEHG